jgi:hypothetical protein
LLERFVGLDSVFDAGFGVDIGEVATGGAATDVIVKVSGADDFPVIFGKRWDTGYWCFIRQRSRLTGTVKETYGRCLRGSEAH